MSTPPSQEPNPFDGTPGPPGQAPLPGQLGYPGQAGVGPAPEPMPAYGYGYGYPPPQPTSTSSVAIVALCLFWVPVVGLVLAIVGMVKTAKGRARGRGLAIAALVLSILVTAGSAIGAVAIASKPSALDPGCTHGKRAVLEESKQVKADQAKGDEGAVKADFDNLLSQLAAAASEAKRNDVRTAVQAVHDDYAGILTGSGDMTKLSSDLAQMDHLCTIGSK